VPVGDGSFSVSRDRVEALASYLVRLRAVAELAVACVRSRAP